jgi:Mg2+ and Co2+ transporter CorA
VTEVVYGLDAAERERVAALRAQGGFFWLDASLSETSLDDLREALGIPDRTLQALPSSGEVSSSRTLHADGQSVVFALRCYVDADTPAGEAAYRLRSLKIHVLVTSDYLLTLHRSKSRCRRFSLPICRRTGESDTSSTRCSRRCSRAPSTRLRRSS